jgi:LPS export ABC transporter protein LptC
MTSRALRRVQLAMLAVLALVAAAVTLTLRRPVESPPPPVTSLVKGEANTTRTGELVYRIYREGRESLVLKARQMQGSEKQELVFQQVELTFPYMARGEAGQGTVTARECRYVPALQKAAFRGDAVVRTADGFELRSDKLDYRADKGVARSDGPVTFRRKDMSGSGTGLVYHAQTGTVELKADVVVRLADPDQVPMKIESGRALLEKDRDTIEFLEGVRAVQGGDTLESDSYFVAFVKQTRAVRHASAYGNVVLTLRGTGGGVPGAAPPALRTSGPRVLRAVKADLYFRPDRSVEELAAGPGAELRLLPGPKEAEGSRTLRARVLVFRLDPQGRLYEVQGQKDSSFLSEPPPGSQAPPLEGTCRSFLARLEPDSGEVREIEFYRDVRFSRGSQQASGGRGRYLADGRLRLSRRPELRDEAQRSRLTAESIDLATRTDDVAAGGGVRHAIEAAPSATAGQSGLLAAGQGATLVVAQDFTYTASTRTSRYEGDALLRAGGDEVRAATLSIAVGAEGKRTFTAEGGVVSRLHPESGRASAAPSQARPPTPAAAGGGARSEGAIEARARLMIYDEARAKIAYRQDVVLRRGLLVTRSPRADLQLGPQGRELQTLVAGEPVELVEGARKVLGTRATYTPADDKVVVEGDKVVLTGPGQEAHGRTLTFRVGDDSIQVDGRDESRTETVFRKEPPKP